MYRHCPLFGDISLPLGFSCVEETGRVTFPLTLAQASCLMLFLDIWFASNESIPFELWIQSLRAFYRAGFDESRADCLNRFFGHLVASLEVLGRG